MANYFSNRNKNSSKKRELREALNAIYIQEQAEHVAYLASVQGIIAAKPGLSASQYANILSNDAQERNSITASIGMMGYMAQANRRGYRCDGHPVCADPAIPSLVPKRTSIKRRFVELDENNNPIGTFEMEQYKTTYTIKED